LLFLKTVQLISCLCYLTLSVTWFSLCKY